MFGEELVEDLVEEGKGHALWVVPVGDDDAADALCPRVRVELLSLLLNGLSQAGLCALCHFTRGEGHEFLGGGAGEPGEGGEITRVAHLVCRLCVVSEDRDGVELDHDGGCW